MVPLKAELEKALSLPVVVTNDVRAATIGEWLHGAGKDVSDLVCIFVGTGIGGGVISGGCLLEGSSNTAGELGHITIVVDGRQCRCPNRGCLEAYAGGWAIAERAIEAVTHSPKSGETLINMAGSIEAITAATVTSGYRLKDPLACQLVDETGHYLASGITGIVNAFNPYLVILGGGVIEGLPELIHVVEERVKSNAIKAATAHLKIVQSFLGSDAGIIGASALAQSKINGNTDFTRHYCES